MNAVNLAAYPMIVKLLDTKGKEAALEYFNTYAVLLLGVSVPAVVGLSLVGPNMVDLVIGEEYKASVTMLLPWVSSAIFCMGAGAFYAHLPFQLGNNNMGIFKIAAVVAVLNLLLNYWLIPKLGMQGAAIATLLSFMVSLTLGVIFGRRVFPIPFPARDIAKIIGASVAMGLCLFLLKDLRGWLWLVAQLSSGLSVFLAAVLLLDIGGARAFIRDKYQREK
ncbi:oligosaccharide flippase family protein [Leucothrix pacifica]|nr:oligosaccharide flippase family protein [Leucothrix pacifica]